MNGLDWILGAQDRATCDLLWTLWGSIGFRKKREIF